MAAWSEPVKVSITSLEGAYPTMMSVGVSDGALEINSRMCWDTNSLPPELREADNSTLKITSDEINAVIEALSGLNGNLNFQKTYVVGFGDRNAVAVPGYKVPEAISYLVTRNQLLSSGYVPPKCSF